MIKHQITDENVIRMALDLGYHGNGWVWEHSVYLEEVTGWLLFSNNNSMLTDPDMGWYFMNRFRHTKYDNDIFLLKYGQYLG